MKLFDEAELNGKPYEKGGYKEIITWDENNIKGFFGEYKYLSNFHKCDVVYLGNRFPSSEHAYMYAKLNKEDQSPELLEKVQKMTCKEVKKWGSTVKLRSDWEEIKYLVMFEILMDKFFRNEDLRNQLLLTGNKFLEETNWWGDVIWGVDIQKGGKNMLGTILMRVRNCLQWIEVHKAMIATV